MNAAGRPGGEQPAGQHLHRLRGGPLAHPDQHRAVADDQHVAALDGSRGGLRPVVPDIEISLGEHRVPAVDGFVADRLRDPGRAAHRVDRHPAVDPAGGVPLVEQVRQRREDKVVRVQRVEGDALRFRPELGDLPFGDPAGQVPGQLSRAQPVHRGAQGSGGQRAVPARVEQPVQDVVAGLRDVQGLGQQVAVVVDQHAPGAQRAGERVVLGLGPAHPQHVVEQQVGDVVGSQPLELQIGAVQDHLPQAADLGIDVKHPTPS
jgi:hypothetical protein